MNGFDLLPHWAKLIVCLPPGVWKQLVDMALVPILVQTFPRVHPEKLLSTDDVVGFIMNLPFALQLEELNGQQLLDRVHPFVQSWIAPNLLDVSLYNLRVLGTEEAARRKRGEGKEWKGTYPWPISCATKDHSVWRAVDSPVPETTELDCCCDDVWQTVPNQATPTSWSYLNN